MQPVCQREQGAGLLLRNFMAYNDLGLLFFEESGWLNLAVRLNSANLTVTRDGI
jgi:hypothetical protein